MKAIRLLALVALALIVTSPASADSIYAPWDNAENEGGGENMDFTAASSRSAVMVPGRYSIIATQNCWWRRGSTTITATVDSTDGAATGSHFLPAGTVWFFKVYQRHIAVKDQIAVIRDTADGKLFLRYEGP